jgi:hypothetical protein
VENGRNDEVSRAEDARRSSGGAVYKLVFSLQSICMCVGRFEEQRLQATWLWCKPNTLSE